MSKYTVNIKGTDLDVYDIIAAYKITNPAIQHAVKKLLKPGTRGHKDLKTDLNDVIQSVERAKELEGFQSRSHEIRKTDLMDWEAFPKLEMRTQNCLEYEYETQKRQNIILYVEDLTWKKCQRIRNFGLRSWLDFEKVRKQFVNNDSPKTNH